jgi:DNA-binding NtrC family response regulator
MSANPEAPLKSADLPVRVLVLDDEPTVRSVLTRLLERSGFEVLPAASIEEADLALRQATVDVAIIDVYLGTGDGLEFCRLLRSRHSDMGLVVISAEDTESLAAKAQQSGADFFLSKPIAASALTHTVGKLAEIRSQRQRAIMLERDLERSMNRNMFPEIVRISDPMNAVLSLVQKVGPRDLSVLVCGESGTGKELIARAVHQASPRSAGNFVELNCAALPPNLVESELFGHEKGSFTGAIASRAGKLQQAHKGTLFLDEIGELPLEIQPKLLRALQEKRIVPVGGREPIHCDFRLISATNRDLVEEVREARFREDLFYRVAVFPIQIPPLRARLEDLDVMLAHFLRQEGMANPQISPGARAMLHAYDWPGNVRELRNFAQAVTIFAEQTYIDEEAVVNYFGSRMQLVAREAGSGLNGDGSRRPVRPLADLEREEILYALRHFEGNVSEAARALGMGRATLYKYIKRHDIEVVAGS